MAEAPGLSRPLALHASNLEPQTSEIDLYHFFSEIQVSVASLRIIRDESTKNARYAYINFISPEDAEKALTNLNYRDFRGREISLSRSIPASQRVPEANVFVSQLPQGCTTEHLANAFSPYGMMISARVNINTQGQRHTYGYVQFDTAESAQRAIAATEASEIPISGGLHKIIASPFKPFSERPRQVPTNVFIRNFPIKQGKAEFEALVQRFGGVTSVFYQDSIQNLQGTAPSETAYGFANYSTSEEAEKALIELNQVVIDGYHIEAFHPRSKAERRREVDERSRAFSSTNANIYVKHLLPNTSIEEIEQFFSAIGEVISFKPVISETGQRTGVAFVQYKSAEDAQKAITAAIGRHWYATLHVPREVRQQQLHRQPYRNNYQRQFRQPNQQRRQPRRYYNNNPYYGGMYPQPRMQPYPYPPQPPMVGYMDQPPPPPHPRQFRNNNNGQRQMRGPHPGGRQQRRRMDMDNGSQDGSQVDQRQKLGEELFWKVQKLDGAQAPKITGMLLEMSHDEVRQILSDEIQLQQKVAEAQSILAQTAQ